MLGKTIANIPQNLPKLEFISSANVAPTIPKNIENIEPNIEYKICWETKTTIEVRIGPPNAPTTPNNQALSFMLNVCNTRILRYNLSTHKEAYYSQGSAYIL